MSAMLSSTNVVASECRLSVEVERLVEIRCLLVGELEGCCMFSPPLLVGEVHVEIRRFAVVALRNRHGEPSGKLGPFGVLMRFRAAKLDPRGYCTVIEEDEHIAVRQFREVPEPGDVVGLVNGEDPLAAAGD